MATGTSIVAQNEQELLHELANHAYELRKSDFSSVGSVSVYHLPLRSSRNVAFNRYNFTRDEGVIRGLNLPQQLMLLKMLSERYGIPLRHLSLRENFDVAYSLDGQQYKEKVLKPVWVFRGEIIEKLPEVYSVHRINGVDVVTVNPVVPKDHLLVEGQEPKHSTEEKQVRQYKAGPALQTAIPTKTGYFSDFKGVIPLDLEISSDKRNYARKGYWNGVYFESDLSAVRCVWYSDEQGLLAYAGRPLIRIDLGVLGIGTDAPLNR